MRDIRFYADIPGTLQQPEHADNTFADDVPVYGKRTTVKQFREASERGEHCNCIALLLGDEHRCVDYSQEALVSVFGHANSGVCLGSVSREYLQKCRRIPESVALALHPRLAERLKSEMESA